jgi:predicted PurR-regulated permease PerM
MATRGSNTDFITWKGCLKLGVCALAVYLCVRYWGGLEHFLGLLLNGIGAILAGIVIAYVVNIPMRFFEGKIGGETGDGTRNRALSMALAILGIVLILLFVCLLVLPNLVDAVVKLAREAPANIEFITSNEFISSVLPASLVVQLQTIDWHQVINDAASWLQSGIVSSLPQVASLVGQIGTWFMGIIFALWYLAEKNRLGTQCHRLVRNYLGESADRKASRALAIIDNSFSHYIIGQSLEGVIFGGLVAIGAAIFGLPDPLMLGALVGVMSLIPMVGALIGAVLGAFIILATSWQQALIFLVVFFIVQQIESNFVYRNVVGKHVGLEGMWPLIGITLGAALFGLAGAFAGVPIISAIYHTVEADMDRREGLEEAESTPLAKLQERLAD